MRVLQLTNTNISTVVVDGFIPLGITSIQYPTANCNSCEVFTVTSSNADTLVIHKSGTYRLDYNASVVATDAGTVTLEVLVNNAEKYSVSATAAEGDTVNLSIPVDFYIPCNCNTLPNSVPAYVQIKNTGVALTSGIGNMIVTRY